MSEVDELLARARIRRRTLDQLAGQMKATLTRGKELQVEVGTLAQSIHDLERATILLNSIGEERQMKAQQTIEELVTRGMQTIFDDTLSFHIIQSVKGKNATVEFVVRSTLDDQVVETPVMDARGGGLAATIGFLLRLIVMLLTKGAHRENILVLDETFAHVSADYLPSLAGFLREVIDKTHIQIVMVTHQPEFAEFADTVYRFTNVGGKTVVKEDG